MLKFTLIVLFGALLNTGVFVAYQHGFIADNTLSIVSYLIGMFIATLLANI